MPHEHAGTSISSMNGSGGVSDVGFEGSTERRGGDSCNAASRVTSAGNEDAGSMDARAFASSGKAVHRIIRAVVSRYRMDGIWSPNDRSAKHLSTSGETSTSSVPSEGHPWALYRSRMESRMLGNLHVRFGERDGET